MKRVPPERVYTWYGVVPCPVCQCERTLRLKDYLDRQERECQSCRARFYVPGVRKDEIRTIPKPRRR